MLTPIQHRQSLNNSDIFNVFKEMSPLAFAYSFYCLLLVGTILLVITITGSGHCDLWQTFRQIIKTIWSMLEALIDQENYQPIIASSRTVWLFFNLFIFVFITSYFLNLISTNQIAPQPPSLIEQISDYRRPEFQHVIPVIPRNYFYYEVLDRSEQGSDLRYVYDRMINEGNCTGSNVYNLNVCNVVSLDMVETPKYMNPIVERFKRSIPRLEIALLASEIECHIVLTFGCMISPETRKNFLKTDSIMSGYLTTLFSKHVPDPIYKILSFRLTSYFLEFGLMTKTYDERTINTVQHTFPQYLADNQYFICRENRQEQIEMEPLPASLNIFQNLIKYCVYVMVVSCMILVCELIGHKILARVEIAKTRTRTVNLFLKQSQLRSRIAVRLNILKYKR